MKNNSVSRSKIIFFASILLNFAFIAGFSLKKIQSTKSSIEPRLSQPGAAQQVSEIHIGYRHLCKDNPKFEKLFQEHQTYCTNQCDELVKLKTELLCCLKEKKTKPAGINRLNKQIHHLTNDLHDKSNRHLLLLKKILKPKDFDSLIDHMISELRTHRQDSNEFNSISNKMHQ